MGTQIRVLVLSHWGATPTAPLLVYGRMTAWSIDGIAKTFPKDAKLRVTPTTTTTSSGTRTTWRIRVNGPTGTILHDGPKPASFVVRGATGSSRLQVYSKPGSYDQYRGVLRIITTSVAPTVTVVNELRMEQYLPGVVPAEMPATWPTEALKAQTIAARSYAARRLRPGVSYYDVTDTTSSQVYRGVLGEKAQTNAVVKATAGIVLKSGSSIANTLFHSTAGGATENNENVYVSATGAITASPVSYLRGSKDRAADSTRLRRRCTVRDVVDPDVHAGPALGHLRERRSHERRHADEARPARSRGLGSLSERHADRDGRDEEGLGRGVPVCLQHPQGERGPAPSKHALRPRARPLTAAL